MAKWLLRLCLVTGPPAAWMSVSAGDGGVGGGNVLHAAQRGLRACVWAAQAGWDYYNAANNAQVLDLHSKWAKQLVDVCSKNGGVYIKVRVCSSADKN